MLTFTKEQLIASAHARIEFAEMMLAGELEPLKERTWSIELELARIALASLEAEPVCVIDQSNLDYLKSGSDADVWPASRTEMGDVLLYRAAPPAPVSVPDEDLLHMAASAIEDLLSNKDRYCSGVWADIPAKLRRAAMLQGADTELQRKAAIHDALCEKYNVESLADFVDWQRNHIAELEAAPPAPVGEGETAVMPDYPGYTMTQRECYQAGKKAGLAEAGNSPVIPDGYAVVPIEPTEDMIVYGFESEPDEDFSDPAVWEEYQAMSGCRQASHRARLCWAAMIAAAPKQGDE
ncbi:hypothetical protein RZR27_18460 [Enterobacter kobei]|uniref:hypothetical protein n=1 Tax=Enterobacter kobei TaxID=208224 RepID=UPI00292AF500|nr:hypothetical protein [Enterobacter kobei]MDV1944434.1 hypothetical protein [Enterobacter kobei]